MFSPFQRVVIFVPLVLLFASYSWGTVSAQPLLPIKMIRPFFQYFFYKYIINIPPWNQYQQILQVFLEEKDLKYLAVPPKLGGPKNQVVFVVLGISLVFVLILISIPYNPSQFIGYIIYTSSIFGFAMSMNDYYNVSYFQMPPAIYGAIISNIVAIVTILK